MKVLYKIYTFCIAIPLFIVSTILTSLAVTIGAMLGDKKFTCCIVTRWWGKSARWLFLIPVKVEGKEFLDKKQSYVFLANHQGYFDIFFLHGYLGHNFKWMMKDYLKKIPFVGYACDKSEQIYVGSTLASIQQAVQRAHKALRGGMSMTIFPEGTRTYDGKMNEFKKGAFTLANETGLPIVPVTINGSFDIFSRTAKSVSHGKITLTIHKPITAEDRKSKPTRIFMKEVFDIINSAVEDKYRLEKQA